MTEKKTPNRSVIYSGDRAPTIREPGAPAARVVTFGDEFEVSPDWEHFALIDNHAAQVELWGGVRFVSTDDPSAGEYRQLADARRTAAAEQERQARVLEARAYGQRPRIEDTNEFAAALAAHEVTA